MVGRGRWAVWLTCTLVLAGCGLGRITTSQDVSSTSTASTAATNERPSPPAPPQQVSAPAATPTEAIRNFTSTYINWTASNVAGQMRALAAQSVGQARSAMELAAVQTEGDYELQQGGIANSGTVVAIAALAGHLDRYAVVTRETTTASNTTAYQGLRPAWHVALVTVTRLGPGRWAVSGWQPEN